MRERKTDRTKVDLTKPVEITGMSDDNCFGKEWDMGTNDCSVCADNILCGIIFSETALKNKAAKMQEKYGVFLDQSDWDKVDDERDIIQWVKSGKTTTKELIAHIGKIANINVEDTETIVSYLTRFIKSDDRIYTKGGVVWLR